MAITIRALPSNDLHRFSEIDRSEVNGIRYRQNGTDLLPQPMGENIPNFSAEGKHHSVAELISTWQPVIDSGGVLLGAFDGDTLAGIGLLGPEPEPSILQVGLLYVDRANRRRGVAGALLKEMERLARQRPADALYVSSSPTESAVGFYLAHGFRPTQPLPGPFDREPDDIHMLLRL
jgi:GNAT superfamily N-acetyltransferase